MALGRKLRVLLVDDSEKEAELLELAFQEKAGLEIIGKAPSGREALAFLAEVAEGREPLPDLVLLDVHMPDRDGFEVLAEMKRDPQLASIPVVMLTTSQRQEDIRRCYAGGASSFVTKPLTFEELSELAQRLVSYWGPVAALPQP